MKTYSKKINALTKAVTVILILLMAQSCGYIIRAIVAPNSCKKCDILSGGAIIETREQCGGGVYNMETKMKARAYDLGADYYVECETYKTE